MLTGPWSDLGDAAVKAILLYVTVLVLLRVGERRTLSDLAPFDIVALVALGSLMGQTAVTTDTPYLVGAIALLTLSIAHRAVSWLRMSRYGLVRRLIDHPPAVLVRDGALCEDELRRSRLTPDDLLSALRSRGIIELTDVRLAIFESKGSLTVIRTGTQAGDLVQAALREADESGRSGTPSPSED